MSDYPNKPSEPIAPNKPYEPKIIEKPKSHKPYYPRILPENLKKGNEPYGIANPTVNTSIAAPNSAAYAHRIAAIAKEMFCYPQDYNKRAFETCVYYVTPSGGVGSADFERTGLDSVDIRLCSWLRRREYHADEKLLKKILSSKDSCFVSDRIGPMVDNYVKSLNSFKTEDIILLKNRRALEKKRRELKIKHPELTIELYLKKSSAEESESEFAEFTFMNGYCYVLTGVDRYIRGAGLTTSAHANSSKAHDQRIQICEHDFVAYMDDDYAIERLRLFIKQAQSSSYPEPSMHWKYCDLMSHYFDKDNVGDEARFDGAGGYRYRKFSSFYKVAK